MRVTNAALKCFTCALRQTQTPARGLLRQALAATEISVTPHSDMSIRAGHLSALSRPLKRGPSDEASLGWLRGFAAKPEGGVKNVKAAADTSVIHPKGGTAAQGVPAVQAESADGKGSTADFVEGEDGKGATTAFKPVGDQPTARGAAKDGYWLMQPVYRKEYVESVHPKHLPPQTIRQHLALRTINAARWLFDRVTGYGPNMKEKDWLRRVVFLETVAGVPGMVGGMLRHMKSLRSMERDHAWIHTLLEEAENERMHLLTFMQLRQPGWFFRVAVLGAQGFFFNFLFVAYLINPRWVHSFVGYLEEEAVRTYTHCIADLDAGKLPEWESKKAPEIAIKYWALQEGRDSMRDLLLAVRADEAGHSFVNHTLSQLKANEVNPFAPGSHEVP